MSESKCPHLEFRCECNVQRIEDTGLKYADIRIICVNCDQPAKFRGLLMGLSPNHPTTDPGEEEVRLPFEIHRGEYNGKGISYGIDLGREKS